MPTTDVMMSFRVVICTTTRYFECIIIIDGAIGSDTFAALRRWHSIKQLHLAIHYIDGGWSFWSLVCQFAASIDWNLRKLYLRLSFIIDSLERIHSWQVYFMKFLIILEHGRRGRPSLAGRHEHRFDSGGCYNSRGKSRIHSYNCISRSAWVGSGG